VRLVLLLRQSRLVRQILFDCLARRLNALRRSVGLLLIDMTRLNAEGQPDGDEAVVNVLTVKL